MGKKCNPPQCDRDDTEHICPLTHAVHYDGLVLLLVRGQTKVSPYVQSKRHAEFPHNGFIHKVPTLRKHCRGSGPERANSHSGNRTRSERIYQQRLRGGAKAGDPKEQTPCAPFHEFPEESQSSVEALGEEPFREDSEASDSWGVTSPRTGRTCTRLGRCAMCSSVKL